MSRRSVAALGLLCLQASGKPSCRGRCGEAPTPATHPRLLELAGRDLHGGGNTGLQKAKGGKLGAIERNGQIARGTGSLRAFVPLILPGGYVCRVGPERDVDELVLGHIPTGLK